MIEIKFRTWDGKRFHYWEFGVHGAVFTGPMATTVEHLIHEQYPGLKDKNGKEIYEGDVVRNINTLEARVVKYGNCRASFSWGAGALDCDLADNSDVVGNIHENQSLK